LLNIGPTPLSEILPIHAQRLRKIGQWLTAHSTSVYGTLNGAGQVLLMWRARALPN
jgi:hypothetical protein